VRAAILIVAALLTSCAAVTPDEFRVDYGRGWGGISGLNRPVDFDTESEWVSAGLTWYLTEPAPRALDPFLVPKVNVVTVPAPPATKPEGKQEPPKGDSSSDAKATLLSAAGTLIMAIAAWLQREKLARGVGDIKASIGKKIKKADPK